MGMREGGRADLEVRQEVWRQQRHWEEEEWEEQGEEGEEEQAWPGEMAGT